MEGRPERPRPVFHRDLEVSKKNPHAKPLSRKEELQLCFLHETVASSASAFATGFRHGAIHFYLTLLSVRICSISVISVLF